LYNLLKVAEIQLPGPCSLDKVASICPTAFEKAKKYVQEVLVAKLNRIEYYPQLIITVNFSSVAINHERRQLLIKRHGTFIDKAQTFRWSYY